MRVYASSTLTLASSVKTTLVSLMGLPRITISATPLSKTLPNVMNLPFISGFISSALDTAAAEYVAPKSLTLDLQALISGDDIKKGQLSLPTALHCIAYTEYRYRSHRYPRRAHPQSDWYQEDGHDRQLRCVSRSPTTRTFSDHARGHVQQIRT